MAPVNRKHSAKRLYHAVRNCDSLKASAIFFAWEDCNFYVDNDENESVVDWKSFEHLDDAVKYLTLKEVPERHGVIRPLDAPVSALVSTVGETATPDHVDSSQRNSHLVVHESIIAAASAATSVTSNKTPFNSAFPEPFRIPTKLFNISASFTKGPAEKREDIWNENFRLLLDFQAEYGTCDFGALVKDTSEKYQGLHAWVRTILLVAGI